MDLKTKAETNFKIDFIEIGAKKSATTWIFNCLTDHPEICEPDTKEMHFFDQPFRYNQGIAEYESYFDQCSSKTIKGEFTPDYLYYEKVPKRIHKHFPDVKLIVCLRDPVERAFSHYSFEKRVKGKTSIYDSFEEAVNKDDFLVGMGYYYKQLKRYYDLFPEENILVLFYEDLKEPPEEFIQKVYRFVGAEPSDFITSSVDEKANPTGEKLVKAKFPWLDSIIYRIGNSIDRESKTYILCDKIGLRKLRNKVLSLHHEKQKSQSKNKKRRESEITPEVESKLRDFYKEDINNLEGLIDKDLSHWK